MNPKTELLIMKILHSFCHNHTPDDEDVKNLDFAVSAADFLQLSREAEERRTSPEDTPKLIGLSSDQEHPGKPSTWCALSNQGTAVVLKLDNDDRKYLMDLFLHKINEAQKARNQIRENGGTVSKFLIEVPEHMGSLFGIDAGFVSINEE